MQLRFAECAAIVTLVMTMTGLPPITEAAHRPVSDASKFESEIDAWMTDALKRLEIVPSVAMAVVVDEDVVLAKGWGTADLENGTPSTKNTVYYIASATKSFTALAAAILHARGVIDLDSPLADHLPGVTMDPALVPGKVKLRDLLTHASGIYNEAIENRLAFTGEHDPETLWNLLAHCTPAKDAPLGTHLYTNVGYNILGMILDRETKKPWQDLLRDEVFQPIGLTRTTAYASLPRRKKWPMAAPYFGLHPDGVQRMYLQKQDNTMQSAGGMMTTVADLGRWLEFQINHGKVDGKQIIDPAIVRATHEPLVEATDGHPPFGKDGYGMGWAHGSYQGERILHHSGDFPGFRTLVSFAADAKVGVAVVVNEGSMASGFADVAGVWAYDWWFEVPETERIITGIVDRFVENKAAICAQTKVEHELRAKREWMLSRPLKAYDGIYRNELHGTVVVTFNDGSLEVRAGNLHCVATAYEKPESARIELVPRDGHVLVFQPEEGDVKSVRIRGNVYERVD